MNCAFGGTFRSVHLALFQWLFEGSRDKCGSSTCPEEINLRFMPRTVRNGVICNWM